MKFIMCQQEKYEDKVERFRKANMGLLDNNQLKPLSDKFKDGEIFRITGAKLGPEIPTDYGNSRPAMFEIDGEWYSIFGQALTRQVTNIDDDDRRMMQDTGMEVKICRGTTKKGQEVKLLVPANTVCDASGKITNPEDIPF